MDILIYGEQVSITIEFRGRRRHILEGVRHGRGTGLPDATHPRSDVAHYAGTSAAREQLSRPG